MLCVPNARVEVVNVAVPSAPTGPLPSTVDPSRNVTVPAVLYVAFPTVAVNVTASPKVDGFSELARTGKMTTGYTGELEAA
jgi:hypothetical protein